MNLYSQHYWKLEKYKQNFENMLDLFKKLDKFDQKFELAMYASNYFVYHNTGYYSSSVLEKF